MHTLAAAATTTLLLLPSTLAAGLYSKSSPVIQVTGQSYDSLIARSNHTSIVEFYAPWCGHCKNLQPAFEKAAKSLNGLAKVAAINCDDEVNKPFCGSMGVQGFPTLKIVRPGKKAGRPNVEDYQGARTAKGIVDAVVDKIPNHVARLKDAEVEGWVGKGGSKAILFSDKGTVSALLKALAIDFLGAIDVAQVRDKEKGVVTEYAVTKFPTLVLLPGDGKDPIKYDGEMKKEPMVAFLSQAASPNPDPAPKKTKASSTGKKDKKSSSKASSSFSKASASHESADSASARATQTSETLEDASNPTESPDPKVDDKKPADLPDIATPITSLPDGLSLQQKCLNDKSGTCILALLSEDTSQFDQGIGQDPTTQVVGSLSEIHAKHEAAKRKLFPFYQIPSANSQAAALRKLLGLGRDIELIAINGKRGWYRQYASDSLAHKDLENWIDEIRMGDGAKSKLPTGLIMPADQLPQEPVVHETPASEAPNAYESIKAEPEGVVVEENDMEGMAEQLRKQMPEGVDFEFEEIDDEEYEKMMKDANKKAKAAKAADGEDGHDEL